MKKIGLLLFNIVVATALMVAVGAPAVLGIGIGALSGVLPGLPSGVAGMAIQKEIWENDIIEGLWAENSFLNYAFNADQYVLAGKVVHIPQAGAAPNAVTNRSTLPATVTVRTDTDVTYAIDEITSDPVLIPNADTVELSYDKRNSVLAETKAAIYETSALNILFKWNPTVATQILRTSGAAIVAHTDLATGNRKALTIADVKAAQKLMNKNKVPSADRYIMIDADMYDQLTTDLSATQWRDFSTAIDPATGIAGKLYGFNIIMRAQVARYTNDAVPVPKSWATAGAATDNASAIAWQKNSVERALGTVSFFEKIGDPQFFGDVYSALVRLSGRIRRADSKGVIAIVQAASV